MNSIPIKEEEKKIISEYVELSNKAKKIYKSRKKIDEALKIYLNCCNLVKDVSSLDTKCECSYYIGLCYYKLNLAEPSLNYFQKTENLLQKVDKNNFPYLKFTGRIYAFITLNLLALDKKEECINYINNDLIYNINNNFLLEQKVVIFLRLIKDILAPIRINNKNKNLSNFIGEYISEQNNILFNGENSIDTKVKTALHSCMNNSTKKIIFNKSNQLFYKYKYGINSNHPLLNFLENNYNISNFEGGGNIAINEFQAKIQIENFIKSNKVKIKEEFKEMKPIDIIKEYLKRIENFNEIWKNIYNIFDGIFKNHLVASKKNKSKSYIEDSRVKSPIKKGISGKRLSCPEPPKELENDLISLHYSGDIHGNNNKKDFKNIKPELNFESDTHIIRNVKKPKIKDDSINFKPKNLNPSLFLEKSNNKKKNSDNYLNYYDKSRIKNINNNPENNNFTRNFNPFLFNTIVKEYQKENLIIRDCDLLNFRFNNYVKSYFSSSKKGHHIVIGFETEDMNQDVTILIPNFLLIKGLFLFGVCDGHGEKGHYVSAFAKTHLPAYFNYIEIDNCISKKNKSIDSLLSSLYNKSENSSVKDVHIIKYFYDKFQLNMNEFSFVKGRFSEIAKNIKEIFYKADNDLLLGKNNFDTYKSGSTCCLLLLFNKTLICSNLGDSRAILCSCNENNNWKSSQLTKDHKPMDKEEYKRIVNSGGTVARMMNIEKDDEEVGPYRVWGKDQAKGPGLAMSRSLGDGMAKKLGVLSEPDVFEYELNQYDKFVVVASDGVWEYLSNDEVMEIVKEVFLGGGKAEEACEVLIKEASNKWKEENGKTCDDISCVIFFLGVKIK